MNEGFLIKDVDLDGVKSTYESALEYGFEGTEADFYTYLGKLWNVVYKDMIGVENGIASLGDDGKVPYYQLPDFIKISEKGVASGVATLGTDGKIPTAQLPDGIGGGGGVGKSFTGETVKYLQYPWLGSPVLEIVAKTGAEIFNDYVTPVYDDLGRLSEGNAAAGYYSSVHGSGNQAIGDYSTVVGGTNCNALGPNSVVGGQASSTWGDSSVGFGNANLIYGNLSVGLGSNNIIGKATVSSETDAVKYANFSIGIGSSNSIYDNNTVAVGQGNISQFKLKEADDVGQYESFNLLLGNNNENISGQNNTIIGRNNKCTKSENYIIGATNKINSDFEYDQGQGIIIGHNNTLDEIQQNVCIGGLNTFDKTLSVDADRIPYPVYQNIVLGFENQIGANRSVVLGSGNKATNNWCVAIGYGVQATGSMATAIGQGAMATGANSFACNGDTTASGEYSFAQGLSSVASGYKASAFQEATASGALSFAATVSQATGRYSAAVGGVASGDSSFSQGAITKASNFGSVAMGKYSKDMTNGATEDTTTGDVFVIGNGHKVYGPSGTPQVYSNAFRVDYAGATYGLSNFNSSGADYAEYFEWLDGNSNSEDRVGYFVAMIDDQITIANPGDYILGIVSGQPCIIGNADEDWLGRWEHDEFGRFIKEYLEITEEEIEIPKGEEEKRNLLLQSDVVEKGEKIYRISSKVVDYETPSWRYKQNPNYDESQSYIERKDRKEWSAVGMLGVLSVRDDGTCTPNSYCKVADGGIATSANEYIPSKTWRVIKRVSSNVVKVVFR